MTAQIPHSIENQCDKVDFGNLRLYSVMIEPWHPEYGPSKKYPFQSVPDKSKRKISRRLYAGNTCHYVLTPNGELYLEKFEYPLNADVTPDTVNEKLIGDFWLIFRVSFEYDDIYVPFVNGLIVSDRSQWKTEADLIKPNFDETEPGV